MHLFMEYLTYKVCNDFGSSWLIYGNNYLLSGYISFVLLRGTVRKYQDFLLFLKNHSVFFKNYFYSFLKYSPPVSSLYTIAIFVGAFVF